MKTKAKEGCTCLKKTSSSNSQQNYLNQDKGFSTVVDKNFPKN